MVSFSKLDIHSNNTLEKICSFYFGGEYTFCGITVFANNSSMRVWVHALHEDTTKERVQVMCKIMFKSICGLLKVLMRHPVFCDDALVCLHIVVVVVFHFIITFLYSGMCVIVCVCRCQTSSITSSSNINIKSNVRKKENKHEKILRHSQEQNTEKHFRSDFLLCCSVTAGGLSRRRHRRHRFHGVMFIVVDIFGVHTHTFTDVYVWVGTGASLQHLLSLGY